MSDRKLPLGARTAQSVALAVLAAPAMHRAGWKPSPEMARRLKFAKDHDIGPREAATLFRLRGVSRG